jgi:hypothetical protein
VRQHADILISPYSYSSLLGLHFRAISQTKKRPETQKSKALNPN